MALYYEVSDPAEREIRKLRRECAKYRHLWKDARDERDALCAELSALKAEARGK